MSDVKRPRLSELCERLFVFLTSFRNQASRWDKGIEETKARLEALLRELRQRAEPWPDLYALYEKAEGPLVMVCDGIIVNSGWRLADDWPLLQKERLGISVGGDKFFRLLDDPSYSDEELQEVFFLCLSVGFEGKFREEPEKLEEIRRRLYLTLKTPLREPEPLTPQAEKELQGEKPVVLPVARFLRAMILLLGVALLLGVGTKVVFHSSVDQLLELSRQIADLDGCDTEASDEPDRIEPSPPSEPTANASTGQPAGQDGAGQESTGRPSSEQKPGAEGPPGDGR